MKRNEFWAMRTIDDKKIIEIDKEKPIVSAFYADVYEVIKVRVTEVGDKCEWREWHDGTYETGCDFYPHRNQDMRLYEFCPYCGRPIKEKKK